ncbi:MAG: metallophosphoesterase family protein [Dehalococcoidales bacterium]|nr:metallophosphoesterase family protein [Dehalococcoidales bacterium]
MRCAILADIHANLEAFTAVLTDIEKRGDVAEIWCLGDIVDYGPDPHACLQLLRAANHVCVAGNHDWAAIGKVSMQSFNDDAITSCQWTAQKLTPEDKDFLMNLPATIQKENFTLAHGSPRDPISEYILYPPTAAENFNHFTTPYCLVGHSHLPGIFKQVGSATNYSIFLSNIGLVIGKNRLIINPGSVGQPRDGDPQASYAIFDSEAKMMRLYRVPYDIEATQNKMLHAGLPLKLVNRLSHGA